MVLVSVIITQQNSMMYHGKEESTSVTNNVVWVHRSTLPHSQSLDVKCTITELSICIVKRSEVEVNMDVVSLCAIFAELEVTEKN